MNGENASTDLTHDGALMATRGMVTMLPGFELEVDERGEWIHFDRPVLDEKWRFVDEQGHGHFYDETAREYPTLRWVELPCAMGRGDDCTSEGYYECRLCAERIQPGTRNAEPQYIRGPRTYRLTVRDGDVVRTYSFGPDQYEALRSVVIAATHGALSDFLTSMEMRSG
jgi:hypothetical protein